MPLFFATAHFDASHALRQMLLPAHAPARCRGYADAGVEDEARRARAAALMLRAAYAGA